MDTELYTAAQSCALLKPHQFCLSANPANQIQNEIVQIWNALFSGPELSLSPSQNTPSQSGLTLWGRQEQALIKFLDLSEPHLEVWQNGVIEIPIPATIADLELDALHNPGAKAKILGRFLAIEEGPKRTFLVDLDAFDGKGRKNWQALCAITTAAIRLGIPTLKLARGIKYYLAFESRNSVADTRTGLEFIDFSDIGDELEAIQVIRLLPKASIVILGGMHQPSDALWNVIEDGEHDVITLSAFGQSVHVDPVLLERVSSADTFPNAVDTCYAIAEQACPVACFTGLGLGTELRAAMRRRFTEEVRAC